MGSSTKQGALTHLVMQCRPVRVAKRLPGCLGAARSRKAHPLRTPPATTLPFPVCKAASHHPDSSTDKQLAVERSLGRVPPSDVTVACASCGISSAAPSSTDAAESMDKQHGLAAHSPAVQHPLPEQPGPFPAAAGCASAASAATAAPAECQQMAAGGYQQQGVSKEPACQGASLHDPMWQNGILCPQRNDEIVGHEGGDQKVCAWGSAASCAPDESSLADETLAQAQDAVNICHAIGPGRCLTTSSPLQPVQGAELDHADSRCGDLDVLCPSPMVQPSPAPLRQRLGLDACSFQPCRRMRLPAAAANAKGPPWQEKAEVEIIEID